MPNTRNRVATCDHERWREDLIHLLKDLRNHCKAEASSSPASSSLDEVIEWIADPASYQSSAAVAEEAREAPARGTAARGSTSGSTGSDNNCGARSPDHDAKQRSQRRLSLSTLSDVARKALATPIREDEGDSRSPALALDCLRLGVPILLFPGAETCREEALDVLSVGAIGSVDERWGVRVAAARLACEVIKGTGHRELSALLSSEQGYWLFGLLFDGHPEVEEAAGIALASSTPVHLDHTGPTPSTTSTTTSSSVLVVMEAASAAMRGACGGLRAISTATLEEREGGGVNARVVDLATEARARMALRIFREGVVMMRPPGARMGVEPLAEVKRTLVEALEGIEAWIFSTLNDSPPNSLPWEEGISIAGDCVDVPGGSLCLEARDAARALLGGGKPDMRTTAMEAAAAAVEELRVECSRLSAGGGEGRAVEDGEEEGNEEEFWRRVYCSLLVRLEVLSVPAEPRASTEREQATNDVTEKRGKEKRRAKELSSTMASLVEEIPGNTCRKDFAVDGDAIDRPLGVDPEPVESIARALEEVPPAYDHAIPSHLDDDDTLSADAKKAIRFRGDRRRRWLISTTHLLLRAGTRLCDRSRTKLPQVSPEGSSAETTEGEARIIKLLVAALPFTQASTDADDPTKAFLACVSPESIHQTSALTCPPIPTTNPEETTTSHGAKITTPVPWKYCVVGLGVLPRHRLLAPWAADPLTVKLATALVQSAWSVLSREEGRSLTDRSAKGVILALRAATRSRGWREGSGVGIKHAVAATIRSLRFPLVTGPVLGHALPLALPLADDHDASHQAVGLSLLLHVAAEATPTELSWHTPLLLKVLEQGLRGGGRDPAATALRLIAAVIFLRGMPKGGAASSGRAGFRIAREALAQAGRTSDGEVRLVTVCGATALLELPETCGGYALCELLRPALLCLLPILQSPPISARLDARAATLRALNALCRSCWPRVHAHSSKLLCALLWTCGDCSRRALERETTDGGKTTVSPRLSDSSITAAADDYVRSHAERLGALVLLLGGSAACATLEEICAAVSALRPAATAMLDLADSARGEVQSAGDEGVCGGGLDEAPSAHASTVSAS